ncbi:hypothetical protein [Mesorhizobium sp.]|uniref:hypothetical protein n=1 Tax=Mesorhizobium sp. TaxID=1871066 RepID=UPI0011F7835A|nr:hypothetical protein [Mesorhizobium sp.]TIL34277.1 MAG: hypothetical protein E5Y85_11080 [Mesorhizobium sp.]
MSLPDPPSFHLRLSPELKAKLLAAKGRNSLNKEILERLDRTFDPDPALRLAEILRPVLASLAEEDRAKMLDLTASAVDILAKASTRKRPRARSDEDDSSRSEI